MAILTLFRHNVLIPANIEKSPIYSTFFVLEGGQDGSKLSDRTGGVKSSFQLWSDVFFIFLSFVQLRSHNATLWLCRRHTHSVFWCEGVRVEGSRVPDCSKSLCPHDEFISKWHSFPHYERAIPALWCSLDLLALWMSLNSTPDWTAIFIKTNSLWKRVE